jgi:hypothetical protein
MTDIGLNGDGSGSRGRIRDLGARVTSTMDTMNATSKRIEETAGWVTISLACVALASIVALGIAVIALVGYRRCGNNDDE